MITILHGDCRELLTTVPDKSVQACVTSPPYWMLRKYTDDSREIGNEPTPDEYVRALASVFSEVWRVLRDDGTLWINLGDTYAKGTKSLIGIPWRVAFALQDAGWLLRNDIIWQKPSCMPESTTDRFTRDHEYIFFFSKQTRYFFNASAVAEPSTGQTGSAANFARATKEDLVPGQSHVQHRIARKPTADSGTRNKRTVWSVPSQRLTEAHYAAYPQRIVETCLMAATQPGDIVLDPFAGSGTTGLVAERLQRAAVLIDLGYQDLQAKRTDKVQVEMFV